MMARSLQEPSSLQELLEKGANDILLYELALIAHGAGNCDGCEQLLRRAIASNADNPLCYLGLVQLLADSGRLTDALPVLDYMIDRGMLLEQAIIFSGDVYQKLGDDDQAIQGYSRALTYPGAAKAAAERLIPLLGKQGRMEEATFIGKKYLKGCC